MTRVWIALAGVSGFLAVAIGAFGAHAISDPGAKALIETGVKYHLAHSIGALVAVLLSERYAQSARLAAPLFLAGCLLFGGSLYLMALGAPRWLGAITPLGGVSFLAGWATLAIAGVMAKPNTPA